jgi:hypothetical protein
MNSARAMLALSATRRKSTRPAPTAASVTMNSTEAAAPQRAGSPAGRERRVHTYRTITPTSARPLVSRWENSMSVAVAGRRGMTSPLQSGQWLPHPAPLPEART